MVFSRLFRPPLSRPRRTAAVALVGLSLVSVSCSKKKPVTHPSASPSPAAAASPAEIAAHFNLNGAHAYDAQDRPAGNGVANDVANKVATLVDTYYNIAFVQPSHWHGGAHPELPSLFTSDAAATVGPNLQTLALGSAAANLAKVQPTVQGLGVIGVLIEPNLSPSYATVGTHFEGTGAPSTAGGTTVHITVDAQFFVDASSYKIAGYDVTMSINGVAKSASYNPPSGAAAAGGTT